MVDLAIDYLGCGGGVGNHIAHLLHLSMSEARTSPDNHVHISKQF